MISQNSEVVYYHVWQQKKKQKQNTTIQILNIMLHKSEFCKL